MTVALEIVTASDVFTMSALSSAVVDEYVWPSCVLAEVISVAALYSRSAELLPPGAPPGAPLGALPLLLGGALIELDCADEALADELVSVEEDPLVAEQAVNNDVDRAAAMTIAANLLAFMTTPSVVLRFNPSLKLGAMMPREP